MTTKRTREPNAWQRFWRWWELESITAHLVMVVILFIIFVPLTWLVGTTFKNRVEFAEHSASLIPTRWSLVNYQYMLTSIENLPIYMRNSFVLAFGTVGLQVFCAALAGYAFARMQFRFRDLIFLGILISMFIPRAGGLMAIYELMTFLHLRNSLLGLILLFAANLPVPIFIMRQAFAAVPHELEDAALIDGCNWFQVFLRIATPVASGGLLVVATLSFIGVWSDYLVTYTLIDKDTSMTISVGIRKLLATSYESALSPRFRGEFAGEAADATMLFTAAIPVIIFYAILQRWFMRGLMEGALKL